MVSVCVFGVVVDGKPTVRFVNNLRPCPEQFQNVNI